MERDELTFGSEAEAGTAAREKNEALGLKHGEYAGGFWEAEQDEAGQWVIAFRQRPVTRWQRVKDFLSEVFWHPWG